MIRAILARLALESLGPLAATERRLGGATAAATRPTALNGRPAADVGIAVDAAPATAAAVPLTIDGRAVAGPVATRTDPVGLSAARLLAATLLGDQVLGDLRLIEVLLVVDRRRELRRSGAGNSELRVPDRTEGRRPRRSAGSCRLLQRLLLVILFVFLDIGRVQWSGRSVGLADVPGLLLAPASASPTASATPPPPAPALGIDAFLVTIGG
jgi:hypothetical protein